MARNWSHLEAPSRLAASYISEGMLCKPANKKRKANGQLRQVAVITMLQKAFAPTSQKGGLLTWKALSSALIAPLSFWSIKLHVITTMYAGRAYGTKNRVRNQLRPGKSPFSNSAAVIPSPHERPTTKTV